MKTLHLDLRAREGVNNNAKGASLATVVRIYQLKDRQAFDNTDYPSLFAGDGQALQAGPGGGKRCSPASGRIGDRRYAHGKPARSCGGGGHVIDPDLTQNSWRLVLTRDET
ncbi:type VI secretion protein [Klebsiella pneumoniae]|uniref:Type VI secretion protein n=1 Tax=Klebsiella pneumoniae TaxID=573 RepID=A0A378FYB2_KLEPN|nr:type VI secretion protein [Klebsiella pneumoniae]